VKAAETSRRVSMESTRSLLAREGSGRGNEILSHACCPVAGAIAAVNDVV
jgi:hypothetical protein